MSRLNHFIMSIAHLIKHSRVKQAAYAIVFGMVGAVLVFGLKTLIFPVPRIATVNISAMIEEFVQQETKNKLTQDQLRERVKLFSQTLEKTIHTIGKKEKLILFPSEAVIDGALDITPQVRQHMPQEKKP